MTTTSLIGPNPLGPKVWTTWIGISGSLGSVSGPSRVLGSMKNEVTESGKMVKVEMGNRKSPEREKGGEP